MKKKDLLKALAGIEPDEEIAVLFWTRDEFETEEGDEPSVIVWERAVNDFGSDHIEQIANEELQEAVWKASK
jgi:hypothetical protein